MFRSAGSIGQGVVVTRLPALVSGLKTKDRVAGQTVSAKLSSFKSVNDIPDAPKPVRQGPTSSSRRGLPADSKDVSDVSDVLPLDIWTSGGAQDYSNGWAVLDGRLDTAWNGVPATGGCWMVFTYQPGITVSNVVVQFAGNSRTNLMMLGAVDVQKWFELPVGTPFENPVFLNYLWFIFPANTTGGVTRINEIFVNGEQKTK
jgi:hypothetical protein